jgi:mRNA-degrading endonuclease RelE of RelBE toxin-antitoxin system
MSYKISTSKVFKRDVKPLSKKYHSLKNELEELFDSLEENPEQGDSLGKSCFKIRLAIKSKGKGKRGGARIVTYVITENKEVILLTIYDKKVKNDLLPNELDELLQELAE